MIAFRKLQQCCTAYKSFFFTVPVMQNVPSVGKKQMNVMDKSRRARKRWFESNQRLRDLGAVLELNDALACMLRALLLLRERFQTQPRNTTDAQEP